MIVAGGVYLEACVSPPSVSLFGSGGRAALGLTSLSPSVTLHAFHPAALADEVYPNFDALGVDLQLHPSSARIAFRYLYPLAKPRITPIPLPHAGTVPVAGEHVLRFGCLEGDFKIEAEFAVYDPQSAMDPAPFGANGSRAKHLAIVLNRSELLAATGLADVADAAGMVMAQEGAEVVVVKSGPQGALVFQPNASAVGVPAFRANAIYKVGSGDAFSAAFAHYWSEGGQTPVEAARLASLHAADYVENRLTPFRAPPLEREPMAASRTSTIDVAWAGAGASGDWLRGEVIDALAEFSISPNFLSPQAAQLRTTSGGWASVLFVVAQRLDDHVLGVISSAQAAGAEVIAYLEDMDANIAGDLTRRGIKVEADLTTALYRVAWS
jgi:hypothetical protein